MHRRYTVRSVLRALFLPVLFVALLGYLTYARLRQQKLNRELIAAVKNQDTESLRSLLQHGADANATDEPDNKRKNLLDLFRDVFHFGKKTDDGPRSALRLATFTRNVPNVKLLLSYGANIKALDGYGWTMLHWAALDGQTDVAKQALNAGIDINAKDHDGHTALIIGLENGSQ